MIGEREAKEEVVSVRKKGEGDKGRISLEKFIEQLQSQVKRRN